MRPYAQFVAVLVAYVMVAAAGMAQTYSVTGRIVVLDGNKSLKGAADSSFIIWLSQENGYSAAHTVNAREAHPRLVQKDKSFHPHLLVVPVGTVVEFPNQDPWFHNVFSLFEGKRFDLGLYEAGTSRLVHFDRAGISYIFCNIHPQMSAVVVTLNTPYWAFADRKGNVNIPNVPAGSYSLHVWSERAASQFLNSAPRDVTVSAKSHTIGDLQVPAGPDLLANHKNKYGQDYDEPTPSSPAYPQP